MRCIVTAGATCEPLDRVRRLTNFSTGKLGTDLARFLCAQGHQVELLLGEAAAWRAPGHPAHVQQFTTGSSLLELLGGLASEPAQALFHAAAVGDFQFGRVWSQAHEEVSLAGKISTREGALLAELLPAPKLLPQLRPLYPRARLVGWKYEVDGDRDSAMAAARNQMSECLTDACVVNGPAYGIGYGLLRPDGAMLAMETAEELFPALGNLVGLSR